MHMYETTTYTVTFLFKCHCMHWTSLRTDCRRYRYRWIVIHLMSKYFALVIPIFSSFVNGIYDIHQVATPSSHPLDRSTAFCHPFHFFSRCASCKLGINSVLPLVLTSLRLAGFFKSQPKSLMAAPAQIAEPRAVDLL